MTPEPEEHDDQSHAPNLMLLRPHKNLSYWAVAGVLLSSLGLFLLTGWSTSVWLFLLYPLFIAILIGSLSLLALHLLRRF